MKNSIALFFLSPFIGFVQALKHYKEDWAKNSVWLFVIFYGFTMHRAEMMDSNRYVLNLKSLYNSPLTWDVFTSNFYSEQSETIDIYQPIVSFILSRFTDNGNILFAVFGVVYGYFYSRNIWLVFDLAKEKRLDRSLWVLMIAFMCVLGFWNLNGVRMWTAAHIFFYGAFQYLVHNKRSGIAVALLSILVHFSFVFPSGALLLFTLVRIPWRILYFLFIGSFFLSALNIGSVRSGLESAAPAFLLPRVDRYTNDEYLEASTDLNESAVWYIKYHVDSLMWLLVALFTIIYFSTPSKSKSSASFSNLFGFSLLILSLGNFTDLLPSGGRFVLVAQMFGVALLVCYFSKFADAFAKRWLLIMTPIFYFFIIVSIRISFDTVSLTTVIGNPIVAVFIDSAIPLIEVFK